MTVLLGEVGWFVDRDADRCHRCGDRNYTERLVCLTCSGDLSGATFLLGSLGGVAAIRDRRRVKV